MIQGLATTLKGGRDTLLRKIIQATRRDSVIDSTARQKLRDRLIQVRGTDGRDRSYRPDVYGDLVEDNTKKSAEGDVATTMSTNMGSDYVRMSPKTHKDWCDIFAGRIFSVSGTDPKVYPLRIIPGGNVPLHPNCVHELLPVSPNEFTDDELRKMSSLPYEFVSLGTDGQASIADYQKVFLQKSPRDWGL